MRRVVWLCLLGWVLAACAPTAPLNPSLTAVTPALDTRAALCDRLASAQTPAAQVLVLEALQAQDFTCTDTQDIAADLRDAYARAAAVTPDAPLTLDTSACPPSNLPPYTPPDTPAIDPLTYPVRGVFYAPVDAPEALLWRWQDAATLDAELALIKEAGLNTVYVDVHMAAFYPCPTALDAVTVTRWERLLDALDANGLRIVAVPRPAPDADLTTTTAQVRDLMRRYADAPMLIAWDIPALDDPAQLDALTTWREVLRESGAVLTATRATSAVELAPLVDVVSVLAGDDLDELRQRVALADTATDKPIWLTYVRGRVVDGEEVVARDAVFDALQFAQAAELNGWMVYRAFDHPRTVCDGITCEPYGLWNTSRFPRLSVDAVTFSAGDY
jgi:hypothetical protein